MRTETVYTNTRELGKGKREKEKEKGKGKGGRYRSNSNDYTFNNLRSPVCGGKRNYIN